MHEEEVQCFRVHVGPLELAKMLEQNGWESLGAIGSPSRVVLPAPLSLRVCIERKGEYRPGAQKSETLDAWCAGQ